MKSFVSILLLAIVFIDVLSAQDNKKRIEVEQLTKTSVSWNGDALPNYPAGVPEVTILRIKIPAGEKLPMHLHPFINAGILLKGKLTVVTEDGKKFHLNAGEALVELVDKMHYGMNEGKETAEIIVFYAGVKEKPITIKK